MLNSTVPPRHSGQSGLTTTEVIALVLLVFVALAIAWPFWSQQRSKHARQVSANNLRQWGIALNLYLGDSQNILPLTGSSETITTADNAWFNALPPYLSHPMLKDLPPAERPGHRNDSFWCNPAAKLPKSGAAPFYFTYGMNAWLSVTSHGLYKIYEIENPMAVVFLAEVEGSTPVARPDSVVPRHGGKSPQDPNASAYFLFCDGHVELKTRAEFSAPKGLEDPLAPSEKLTWVPFLNAPTP
jgi:prepilin-type processing-associated H-X9-DG protein